jgi:protein regulator of cytokinesis 1
MDTSYLAQQVNAIVGQLHGLFDEIGVPNHDRDAREEEVRDPSLGPSLLGSPY